MPSAPAENMQKLLTDVPLLTELSGEQRDAVLRLVDNPAFQLFLGYMKAAKQGLLAALQYHPVGTATADAQLAVIQGKTQGIDLWAQSLIELANLEAPADEGTS